MTQSVLGGLKTGLSLVGILTVLEFLGSQRKRFLVCLSLFHKMLENLLGVVASGRNF